MRTERTRLRRDAPWDQANRSLSWSDALNRASAIFQGPKASGCPKAAGNFLSTIR